MVSMRVPPRVSGKALTPLTSYGKAPQFIGPIPEFEGNAMPKEEWGVKRICPTTGKRFYDLNKSPIVSPYTGDVVVIDTGAKTRVLAADKDDVDAKKIKDDDDLLLDDDDEDLDDDAAIESDDTVLEDDDDDDTVSLDEIADVGNYDDD
jgi:uncharacterized protein (TIGR02300 family)